MLAIDRESGEMRERLRLRPELKVFVRVLSERLPFVAALEDEHFARPRAIEPDADGRVYVVSDYVPGRRLSDILDASADHGIVAGLDAGLGLLLELLPALSRLHDAGITHGALAPGRIVVTTDGRVVVVDAIYAEALERLQLTRKRLWSELRLAFPSTAGAPRFDKAADLTQAALTAAALMIGRPLREDEYPDGLPALRQEIVEIASIRASKAFADGLDRFFGAALPLATRRTALTSADEAGIDIRKLLRKEVGITTCRNAMLEFFQQVDTAERERAGSSVTELARREAERLETERAEAAIREQARLEVERANRERTDAEARARAREDAERQAREDAERKVRADAERWLREEAERPVREEAERQAREEAERRAREDAERRRGKRRTQGPRGAERKARDEAERKAREAAERKPARSRTQGAAEPNARPVKRPNARPAKRPNQAREEAERKARRQPNAKREGRTQGPREAERAREARNARRAKKPNARRRRGRGKAREEARRKAREEAERKPAKKERKAREAPSGREAAERKAREEAERKAREAAERKAREEAERKAREEAERKVREEAERKAREEAERKIREEAERKVREEAERKAREDAERRERERAEEETRERIARAQVEAERLEREQIEAERRERERTEQQLRERIERARGEAERVGRERTEGERAERERVERARVETERREAERASASASNERRGANGWNGKRRSATKRSARPRSLPSWPPKSDDAWLVRPDKAAAFEPVVDDAPAPPPQTTGGSYPIYAPSAETDSWTPELEPPPAIEIAPVASSTPASTGIRLQGPTATPTIRLKEDLPAASPARGEIRREPVTLSATNSYEPIFGIEREEPRQIPWKLIAAGVVLVAGSFGIAKGLLSSDAPNATPAKSPAPEVKKAEPPPPAPVGTTVGRVTVTSDPAGLRVLIDGKAAGTSPTTIEKVSPGKHVVTLQGPGGIDEAQHSRRSRETVSLRRARVLRVRRVRERPSSSRSPRTAR